MAAWIPAPIGVNGLMEKDLVLAEGLKLARELRRRGYSVHMTRDSDTFIPLRRAGRHSAQRTMPTC